MYVTFDHSARTAKNIRTFYFKPATPTQYTPGQFTELYLPHNDPDERGQKHWFTLSSSPTERLLSITTKFSDQGSSYKRNLRQLKPGTKVSVADMMGDFVLPKSKNRPLVFVAGGIGATPFRSMVKWLSDTQEKRFIQMIYAVSDPQELAFGELFENYGLDFTPLTKQPPANWKGRVGILNGQTILDICGSVKDKLIYLSGPEPLVETLQEDLQNLGVDKNQLVTDFFPGYKQI